MAYRGTITNAGTCVASCVNVLSGGEMMENVYVDMIGRIHGNQPDEAQEERTAEEIKTSIMDRLNSLKEV